MSAVERIIAEVNRPAASMKPARNPRPARATWEDLAAELARWRSQGRTPTFWWRDDDAVENTQALGRLLDLRNNLQVPLSLAVVPAPAKPSLVDALGYTSSTAVLQHGWLHQNYGTPGGTKVELGAGRPIWEICAELTKGRRLLMELLEPVLLPVLVPPYNAIDEALVPVLGRIGYRGYSTSSARRMRTPAAGLVQSNIHIDLVDWHGTRLFVGDDVALNRAVEHLAARRLRRVDPDEPTGMNTHHLVHDEPAWQFVERFIRETVALGGEWLSAETVFGLPPLANASVRMQERALQPGPACNICGGTLFGTGPHARKSFANPDLNPRCARCNSLERHRATYAVYSCLDPKLLNWRKILFLAPDPSLDHKWFLSVETSEYLGENSIDIQSIERANGAYDLVALNQTIEMVPDDRKAFSELVRITSEQGVIQIVFLTELTGTGGEHYPEPVPPHNWHHLYDRDVFKRLGTAKLGLRVLKVYQNDPVTNYRQLVCFMFRDSKQLELWKSCWTAAGLEVEEEAPAA